MYKTIWLIIAIMLLVGTGWYYFQEKEKVILGEKISQISVQTDKTWLHFSDAWISEMKNYDYYQVYVFPLKYEVECKTELLWVCDTLMQKQKMLGDFIMAYHSKDLKNTSLWEVSISLFDNTQMSDEMLQNMFYMLYNPPQKSSIISPYEKYFDFKEQDVNGRVSLNSMEISCVEQIKMKIPSGSFNEEWEIKRLVQEECSGYQNLSPLQVWAPSPESGEKNNIQFGLKLQELRLQYKFFRKINGKFEEKYQESKNIPFVQNLQTTFPAE